MKGAALRPLWLLTWFTLCGCPDKSGGLVLIKNVCATDVDCLELDASPDAQVAHCNETTLQCERDEVDTPYPLVLQVRPNSPDPGLVEEVTFGARTLDPPMDFTLDVPAAVPISGTVSWIKEGSTVPLESEVTFVPLPKNLGSPVTSEVVNTTGGPGATTPNLQTNLLPDTNYQIRVQPLLEESTMLPPISESHSNPSGRLDISYVDVESRAGRLEDEFGRPFVGHRVRLEEKLTGEVLSSTAQTDKLGEFALYALPSVMAGKSFDLVVSLEPFPPWRVKVAIDGSKLIEDAPVVLPRVPASVEIVGSLLPRKPIGGKQLPVPQADIIFVSSFPVPTGPDPRDSDWCRWERGSSDAANPPRCSASIATTADAEGKYSLALLPGVYEVFVVPRSQSLTAPVPLRTTRSSITVLNQGGKPQDGQTLYLDRAAQFKGRLVSFRGEPMPNVTVNARALVPRDDRPNSQVYKYARSSVAVTNNQGGFFLNSDLGYFDFSVEPTKESGFAWVQSLNREVDQALNDAGEPLESDAGVVALKELVARAPVIVAGRVVHQGQPLPGAVVEAFALVVSVAQGGGQRSVRVAQAISDADGYYRLALPPEARAEEERDAGE